MLYHTIVHLSKAAKCCCFILSSQESGRCFLSTPSSPFLLLEHHSDPLGAFDRDMHHSAGIFCPVLCCLCLLLGPTLLPSEDEIWTPHQRSESSNTHCAFLQITMSALLLFKSSHLLFHFILFSG